MFVELGRNSGFSSSGNATLPTGTQGILVETGPAVMQPPAFPGLLVLALMAVSVAHVALMLPRNGWLSAAETQEQQGLLPTWTGF